MRPIFKPIIQDPETKQDLIQYLRAFTAPNYFYFLDSLTYDQLLVVKELEDLYAADSSGKSAADRARTLLKTMRWPSDLSANGMNYDIYIEDLSNRCKGIRALYYYVFDKCIERKANGKERNSGKNFMVRLATFAKASIRETWITAQTWRINQDLVKVEFNNKSGNHTMLLPERGQFAADFMFTVVDEAGNPKNRPVPVEERPIRRGWDVLEAAKLYTDPKSRYYADRVMLSSPERNSYHIYNYRTQSAYIMEPQDIYNVLTYPQALQNI
jgi:hypothetical protein